MSAGMEEVIQYFFFHIQNNQHQSRYQSLCYECRWRSILIFYQFRKPFLMFKPTLLVPNVINGVPQGAVCGTLIFAFDINWLHQP